jgi:hypothetical protein
LRGNDPLPVKTLGWEEVVVEILSAGGSMMYDVLYSTNDEN